MNTEEKKRIAVVVCLVLLVYALMIGGYFFARSHVYLSGRFYHLETEELSLQSKKMPKLESLFRLEHLKKLDLRGTGVTPDEFNQILAEMPDCQVQWDIGFQGKFYSPETEEMTITSLTSEEAHILAGFPALKKLDARDCPDAEALAIFTNEKPECQADYSIELDGKNFGRNAREIKVSPDCAEAMIQRLPALPELRKVTFAEGRPEDLQLQALRTHFPEICFVYETSLLGEKHMSTDATVEVPSSALDSMEDLIAELSYFMDLKQISFTGSEPSRKLRDQLQAAYPELEIIYNIQIGDASFPSDSKIIDISGHPNLSLTQLEWVMNKFPHLERIIVCDCGFKNEDLDALNKKYEDIRIVWNVFIEGKSIRTDETYFYPYKLGIHVSSESIAPLRYCTDMVCIDIGHNWLVKDIEWVRDMKDLKWLILVETGVTDLSPLENHTKLEFLEIFLTAIRDFSPLVSCTGLEDLNMCYCVGDPEPIKQMTWLKRLWWSANRISRQELYDELPNTQKEFNSVESTGAGWRTGHLYYEMRDLMDMFYLG